VRTLTTAIVTFALLAAAGTAYASGTRIISGDRNVYVNFQAPSAGFTFDVERPGVMVGLLACRDTTAPLPVFDRGAVTTQRQRDGSVEFTVRVSPADLRGGDGHIRVEVASSGTDSCTMNLLHGGIVTNFRPSGGVQQDGSDPGSWADTPFVVVVASKS
jgi:hypothetical protein